MESMIAIELEARKLLDNTESVSRLYGSLGILPFHKLDSHLFIASLLPTQVCLSPTHSFWPEFACLNQML